MSRASDFRERIHQLPHDEKFAGKVKLAEIIIQNIPLEDGENYTPLYTHEQIKDIMAEITTEEAATWYSLYWAVEEWLVSACQIAAKVRVMLMQGIDMYTEMIRTALFVEYTKNSVKNQLPDEAISHLQKIGVERFVSTDKEKILIPEAFPRVFKLLNAYNAAVAAVGEETELPELDALCFDVDEAWEKIDEANTLIDCLRKAVESSRFYNSDEEMRSALLEAIQTVLPGINKKELQKESRIKAKNLNAFKKMIRNLDAFRSETSRMVSEMAEDM